jgi:hypothetical protein
MGFIVLYLIGLLIRCLKYMYLLDRGKPEPEVKVRSTKAVRIEPEVKATSVKEVQSA